MENKSTLRSNFLFRLKQDVISAFSLYYTMQTEFESVEDCIDNLEIELKNLDK